MNNAICMQFTSPSVWWIGAFFVPIETAAIWRGEHGGRNAITQNDNVGRDLNIFVFL